MQHKNKSPQIVGAIEGSNTNQMDNNSIEMPVDENQYDAIASEIKIADQKELQYTTHEYEPLVDKINSEPYPYDALPATIRKAVAEVRKFTKAPLPLIASSAISALSLAAQPQIDVKRDEKLLGPTGLFILTIADSGERKSTVDGYFTKSIRDHETDEIQKAAIVIMNYKNDLLQWKAKQDGLLLTIKKATAKGECTKAVEEKLNALKQEKPKPPKVPKILYTLIEHGEMKRMLEEIVHARKMGR